MIGASDINQAERLLRIVVGDGMDVPGQFSHYQIDRMAYENYHQEQMSLLIRRSQEINAPIPQKLVPTINTLMVHHFLVGFVCGRSSPIERT